MTLKLLTDAQIREFLVEGCITLQPSLPASFHRAIYDELDRIVPADHVEIPGKGKKNNPGNNVLPLIPALGDLLEDPVVKGALVSLVGAGHMIEPHRALHNARRVDGEQVLHKDSYMGFKRHVRSHRPWTVLIFYYPQDTPPERGPTGVVPASQYTLRSPGWATAQARPLGGKAGSVCIGAFDIWHGRMQNRTDDKRFMLKFLASRIAAPTAPSWDCADRQWTPPNAPPPQFDLEPVWHSAWDWLAGKAPANGVALSQAEIARLAGDVEGDDENRALCAAYALARAGEAGAAALGRTLTARSVDNLADDSITTDMGRQYGEGPAARAAAYGLAAGGEAAARELVAAIDAPRSQARKLAAFGLGESLVDSSEVDAALARAGRDADPQVRINARYAIGRRGVSTDTSLAAVREGLGDREDEARIHAALALARLAPRSAEAIEAATAALGDSNRYVVGYAAETLERIGTQEALAALLPFLRRARWCPFTRSGESIY
jgi:hypothetical protein